MKSRWLLLDGLAHLCWCFGLTDAIKAYCQGVGAALKELRVSLKLGCKDGQYEVLPRAWQSAEAVKRARRRLVLALIRHANQITIYVDCHRRRHGIARRVFASKKTFRIAPANVLYDTDV
jgi:hypothetical protein